MSGAVQAPIILLDGAMGTELAARGFEQKPPLFSARALLDEPELVAAIHRDYLRAGAQVLTTNSFNLHPSTLAAAGITEQQATLARRSVELLEPLRQRARVEGPPCARVRIAGSIPPRPRSDGRSDPAIARAEYRSYAEALVRAGVDLLLLETFTSIAEAELALAGLTGLDLPIWLSVVAGAPSKGARPDGARLIGGDPLTELAGLGDRVDALLINCTQLDALPRALDLLATIPGLPLGVSPHFGKRNDDGQWIDRSVDADTFAERMRAWLLPLDEGSRAEGSRAKGRGKWLHGLLLGACCGSKPVDIAALRTRLQPDHERERAWLRLAELVP